MAIRVESIERVELEIVFEQIAALKQSIKRLDEIIAEAGAQLAGFENLISITGIEAHLAGVLLAVKGFGWGFADESKLASYARDCAARC